MKNSYEVHGDRITIYLKSPKYGDRETVISTTKLNRALEFPNTWCLRRDLHTNSYYVFGNITENGRRRIVTLHRWIMSESELSVDHINHDGLDNTDSNLRIVTNAENMQNRKSAQSNSVSGIRGVYWHKSSKSWCAQVRLRGKNISVGYFKDILQAELAVIEARKKFLPLSVS